MYIILRKAVDCGHLGYLPPETRLEMPADSAALAQRWIDEGYAEEIAPEPPGSVYAVEYEAEWISDDTAEAADD